MTHPFATDDEPILIRRAAAALLRAPAVDLDDEPQLLRRLHDDHFRLREIVDLLPGIRAMARHVRAAGLASCVAFAAIDSAAAHVAPDYAARMEAERWQATGFAVLVGLAAAIVVLATALGADALRRRAGR
ncbi:hypothetical protein [Methylosinus sp. LW4]|uniref:hypothetical protein n=1 Tax=Methylosinus sp. LW4 TaxID=136993 RepID=UPI00036B95F4|nr:hypothetical protein [Methylosinus sp. LW4]